jgi:Recombinase
MTGAISDLGNRVAARSDEAVNVPEAEFEREMIRERVVAGMERHAVAGKWFGGVYPYGYTLDTATHKLMTVPGQAPLVREIYRLYTTQRLGTQAIARRLNAHGSRTRTGGPWSAPTIAGILTNRVYLGELTFRQATVTGAHPPLIDQATFDHASAIMDARGEDHTRRAANASDYHLSASAVIADHVGRVIHGNPIGLPAMAFNELGGYPRGAGLSATANASIWGRGAMWVWS